MTEVTPLLNSIEIVEDGESSLYGSDAIAGVVKIIKKTSRDSICDTNFQQMRKQEKEMPTKWVSFGV